MLIDRQTDSKTAIVTKTAAVPLTRSLPRTEVEKITEYENVALEIKNIWKLNNVSVHPLVISGEVMFFRNFLKYVDNKGLSKTS